MFVPQLAKDLRADIKALLPVLKKCGDWEPDRDAKLEKLLELLSKTHPNEKVLVFTQFADTVHYLERQLRNSGIGRLAGVTGDTDDPTRYAWRFSPESNHKRQQVSPEQELRVLVATDVLSEGQNLQDAAIVVNYDLPWAIIRLVQRAGRVDRIGQKAETILCYSFLPADGVERILRLRTRVRQRLRENAEVVGTDEHFFEDDQDEQTIRDLFTEKSGILDDDPDSEVDLSSYAYQIWKNAIDRDPSLEKTIPALPEVVYSTRPHAPARGSPRACWSMSARPRATTPWPGWTARARTSPSRSLPSSRRPSALPDTPALPRQENHHDLVAQGVQLIAAEEKTVGGQLGRPSGARFRTYERLKHYVEEIEGTLLDWPGSPASPQQGHRGNLHLSVAADGDRHAQPAASQRNRRRQTRGIGGRAAGRRPAVHHPRRRATTRTPDHLLDGTPGTGVTHMYLIDFDEYGKERSGQGRCPESVRTGPFWSLQQV